MSAAVDRIDRWLVRKMPVEIPDYFLEDELHQYLDHPLAILKAAATQMADRTRGQVLGSVFTLNPGGSNLFRYTFLLIAPSLDDYSASLFYVWHNVKPYPVHMMNADGKQGRDDHKYANREDFEQALSGIFASESTRQRIYTLLEAVKATRSR